MLKFVLSKRFGEDISHFSVGSDVLEIDVSHDDMFPNIVTMHLNVLRLGMENRVSGYLYATLVVAVDM